jgi:aldehyde:ferredoxin oxidoreductase
MVGSEVWKSGDHSSPSGTDCHSGNLWVACWAKAHAVPPNLWSTKAVPLAMQVKSVEMTCFEPRGQTNLALGFATAPIGPRYDICEHDWDFDTRSGWSHTLESSRTLGILRRIPMDYLGPDKVRNFKVLNNLWSACDALDFCIFASAPTRARR